MSNNRMVRLFGIGIDALRMDEAVARVLTWLNGPPAGCRYVVTPNVDHTLLFQQSEEFRRVYDDAGLVLADGMPVVVASRLLRRPLPERVTGADLVPALFEAAVPARPMRVYLLGAGPGVAARAAAAIVARWPAVQVVGIDSPPLGFEKNEAENAAILRRIAAATPDVVVVGLGAPKQELWVHRHRGQIEARVALCVGAAIDFLAGEKPRAPLWMRRFGLEWAHRLGSEPRRLFKRYARDAWIFPQLVWREVRRAQ
jgi:N-acetylglucosaminyldiphosphoundecaprenol N-acetyl-beta-D-mannosaminyltransferase